MDLVERLRVLLGTVFVTYYKTHGYHWNVSGPLFPQMHSFFGEYYSDLFNSVDDIAEEIRKYDQFPSTSLSRLTQLSVVMEETAVPEHMVMVRNLYNDNKTIIEVLYSCRAIADSLGRSGTVNFLEERISKHEKWEWMLKSILN